MTISISIHWITLAVMGAISIFDAHLIQRRMPGWRSFILSAGACIFGLAVVLFCIIPVPTGVGADAWVATATAGILRGIGFTLMLRALHDEEIARVAPVVGIYPVFVALLAIPLLGEQLSNWQWFAVAVVVSGAVLISVKRDGRHRGPFITRTFWKLVAAALIFAFSDVGNKYALESLPTWNVYTINIFFMALAFAAVTLRLDVLRTLRDMPQRSFNLFLVLLNVAIGMLGTWLIFLAMDAGPVSLVSTITSSRHAFVIFYGLLMHKIVANFIEWDSGLVPFLVRLVATLMIIGGIAVIYLT
jgi:uncharacterized membrane protein